MVPGPSVFANPGLRRLELAAVGSFAGLVYTPSPLAIFAFDAGGTTGGHRDALPDAAGGLHSSVHRRDQRLPPAPPGDADRRPLSRVRADVRHRADRRRRLPAGPCLRVGRRQRDVLRGASPRRGRDPPGPGTFAGRVDGRQRDLEHDPEASGAGQRSAACWSPSAGRRWASPSQPPPSTWSAATAWRIQEPAREPRDPAVPSRSPAKCRPGSAPSDPVVRSPCRSGCTAVTLAAGFASRADRRDRPRPGRHGEGGVGTLLAVMGVGGLVGAAIALPLASPLAAGRHVLHSARPARGLPIVLIAGWSTPLLLALAAVGAQHAGRRLRADTPAARRPRGRAGPPRSACWRACSSGRSGSAASWHRAPGRRARAAAAGAATLARRRQRTRGVAAAGGTGGAARRRGPEPVLEEPGLGRPAPSSPPATR